MLGWPDHYSTGGRLVKIKFLIVTWEENNKTGGHQPIIWQSLLSIESSQNINKFPIMFLLLQLD